MKIVENVQNVFLKSLKLFAALKRLCAMEVDTG